MHALSLAVVQANEAAQSSQSSQTVWEFLVSGGYIMIPLAICSVVVLALAMDRYLRLKKSGIVPESIDESIELLRKGDQEAALESARALDVPVSRILVAGMQRRNMDLDHIERAMEDQGQREYERLRANIRPMMLVASIAPLLGLLGTVMGIQDSFALIVTGGMKPENFAGGIEEALVTTITGLSVAIPALLLGAHFNGKVRRLMGDCDERLTPVLDLLIQQQDTQQAA